MLYRSTVRVLYIGEKFSEKFIFAMDETNLFCHGYTIFISRLYLGRTLGLRNEKASETVNLAN